QEKVSGIHFLCSARQLSILHVGFDPASASSRMNHYEKGRHVPDIDTIRRMAAELNVPLNYFFVMIRQQQNLHCSYPG
ncbi:helix-turn-helix domain-containing protein, partial [Escherichia coli]|uniref:helix-turn-helix domain-containing protein n=1 Tax=Escherichia coli TaxID=562 RepID=UPI00215191CB